MAPSGNDRVEHSVEETQRELSRCAQRLLMKEPFYGHLLARVARQVTDETPTAGVTIRDGVVVLMVNPRFFMETTKQRRQRVAVLKHELLHVVLRHVVRASTTRDPQLWNIASDLVVNQLIGGWPLPSDAVTLATFADLQLPSDATADRYYALLKKHASSSDEGGGRSRTERTLERKTRWHSDHDHWVVGQPEETTDGSRATPLSTPHAGDAELEGTLDSWVGAAASKLSREERDALPGLVRGMIERAVRTQRAALDWRRAMRTFVSSSRRTRIDRTLRRPSRRFGTFPGIRVRRYARIAVVVDTSASIGDRELDQFFAEVHAIAQQGAELTVVECDAEVQAAFLYRGLRPSRARGGGGTSFDPAFKYLLATPGPWDACIYLTDGEAPAPTLRPPCPLLWVLSGLKSHEHLGVGRVVRLTSNSR